MPPLPHPDPASLADAAIADRLGAWPVAPLPATGHATDAAPAAPAEVWLQRLSVAGFRGAGPPLALELRPGPGLTVVAARNGTGKSTLSDGLEVLLTGQAARWHGRDQAASSGWRNLHQPLADVRATFLVDGRDVDARVAWSTDKVSSAHTELSEDQAVPLGAAALEACPVLACGELGERLRGTPAKVYDTVASVLGLGPLLEGRDRLAALRRAQVTQRKAHRTAGEALRADVAACEAVPAEVRVALAGDAAGLRAALDHELQARQARQQGPAGWQIPDKQRLLDQADQLEQTYVALQAAEATAADHTTDQAALLLAALPLVEGRRCPLCGTDEALSDDWAAHARAQVQAAQGAQATLTRARRAVADADSALAVLLAAVPTAEGLPAAWSEVPTGPARAHHVRLLWPTVHASLVAKRDAALAGQRHQQQAWAPLAHRLSQWVDAEAAQAEGDAVIECIAEAESLLHTRVEARRAERFAPLRARALALWSQLRRGSSVQLDDVALTGRRTRRKLELSATIEGKEAAAQGVMSQGELNALALAVFLPRALLDSQPFRFVVIDDPVQAMDPSKVAGLAEVLREVAATRQVVVLTHDERLLQALRWQRVPHRTLRLERGSDSTLSLHPTDEPVAQLLAEAHVVLSSGLDAEVKGRAVPGLCRLALDQALREQLGRRWVGQGLSAPAIHARLEAHAATRELMAWWWFDDPTALDGLAEALGRTVPDGEALYHALQQGSHGHRLRVGQLPARTRALVDALGSP